MAIKDNVTHQTCKINSFKAWVDGGAKDIMMEDGSPYCTDLVKIKQKKGEYLCMFEVEFAYYPEMNETGSLAGSFKT